MQFVFDVVQSRAKNLKFMLLMLIFIGFNTSCQRASPVNTNTDSPKGLLVCILELAKMGKYDDMKDLLYPGEAFPGITTQDAIIQVMKENRGLEYTGDFSYSNEALEIIIQGYSEKFTSKIDGFWLKSAEEGGLVDNNLMKLTGGDPKKFKIFDYHNVHIVLVNIDGSYKLLFWEGMNHI